MTTMLDVLGLDVGGANLKAAHTRGVARSRPFALWKQPAGLANALRALAHELPPAECWAVTMTGELCDCFPSKRAGVAAILNAVQEAAGSTAVRVWQTDARFADPAAARADPLPVAAANWLALATFAGRHVPAGAALLVDVGSTTTDIIPLLDGRPMPAGRTDPERLQSRELVYTGVRRTPVCALLGGTGAAEFFATTHDVYLVLGEVPEDDADCDTADGRPATRAAAHARLARMLCADVETSTADQRERLARDVRTRQLRLVQEAVATVALTLPAPPHVVLLAGSGEFLARALVAALPGPNVVSLAERLGPTISAAACAYAVAVLAQEECHDR